MVEDAEFDVQTELSVIAPGVPVADDDTTVGEEVRMFASLALPSVVIQVFVLLTGVETAMAVGQMQGPDELAGVSLGTLVGNITGLSLMFGMLTGFDTLAPHAVGLNQLRDVGILAQRGFYLSALAFVPACVPWAFASSLLQFIGQPREAADLAASFLQYYILAVPAYLGYEVCRRFLIVQNIVTPFIAIGGVTALFVHPTCLALLIPSLGFIGAPIAHVLSAWIQLTICVLYMLWSKPHNPASWPGFVLWEVFERPQVFDYLKLGGPGILSMSEWWFWEVLCFTAGEMGTQTLAAHTVAYNLLPIMFMVPMGMSIGANVRIGTLLASGSPRRARQVAVGTVAAYMVVGVVLCAIAYMCRDPWAQLFTDDKSVLDLVNSIWGLVCFDVWIDSLFGVQSGIMRGIGMQLETSYGVIICLWLGYPFVRLACFHWGGGLVGLWSCMPALYGLLNCMLAVFWLRRDFKQLSEEVISKAGQNDAQKHEQTPSIPDNESLSMSEETKYSRVDSTIDESPPLELLERDKILTGGDIAHVGTTTKHGVL